MQHLGLLNVDDANGVTVRDLISTEQHEGRLKAYCQSWKEKYLALWKRPVDEMEKRLAFT